MLLINCEINFVLTCYEDCILISRSVIDQVQKFPITDTKPDYCSVVTLSI